MTTSSRIDLEATLRARLPEVALSSDVAAYAIDGLTPTFVALPSSAEEVASILAAANNVGAAVVSWGAGTQMQIGMPPERYDLALDLRGLNRVIEYEPADLTVTVETGMTLADLQSRLHDGGQWLPIDPLVDQAATIGGLLATNASGPARHSRGTLRDLVIGMAVALPSGSLIKSGGRVVKNVAGYDLGKLQIGALGTLGVIVQASFKLTPLPALSSTVSVTADFDKIMSINSRLATAGLATESLCLVKQPGPLVTTLVVRFAGGNAAVERSRRDFASMVEGLKVETGDGGNVTTARALLQSAVVAKASVSPTAVSETWQRLDRAGAAIVCFPSAGIVYGAWAAADAVGADAIRDLRRFCVDAGKGALVLERAPFELKRDASVWGEPRGDFELMRRLKQEFDPNRVLNPGRFLGGL